ncbi:CBS domain-containing protein [Gillisia sp. Hel1_33_143]|uniref:CBS domain-containing protein n=1 Tax=unclassified Gillisia TaxID=2615025 RepID=UPI000553EA9D|nr:MULTISPECIES: CBS domain-containing protein [unclassified Gillisia]SDR71074.1 CBS domain-containing protein [Gillisia sp. Hel1_33_143]
MSIESHIINDVGIQNLGTSVKELQKLFNKLTYSHLPVQNEGVYLGSISENDIRCFETDRTIKDYQYSLEGFFVRDTDYWLDTLETFAQNQTNILPVLNSENKYLGYLELSDIINFFNETPFLNEPGGILVIEKLNKDISFSEISQIVESHNAAFLGMFVSSRSADLTQVTIKLSTSVLNDILQTFRRYGYSIISEHQEDSFQKNLDDRSDYLDKYLNI